MSRARTPAAYLILSALALPLASTAHAQTAAYWRFEAGPPDIDIPHLSEFGVFGADVLDVSGNGNHLSTFGQGGFAGYGYRASVGEATIPLNGAENLFSAKNTGGAPGMFTDASRSLPTGVNIDTFTPREFTVEVSFKIEANGNYRTIVGRDARFVNGSSDNSALSRIFDTFFTKAGGDGGIDIAMGGLVPGNTYKIDLLQSVIGFGPHEQAVLINGQFKTLAMLQQGDGNLQHGYNTVVTGIADASGNITLGVRPSAAYGGTGPQDGCSIAGMALSEVLDGTPITPSTVEVTDGAPGHGLTLDPARVVGAVNTGDGGDGYVVQGVNFTRTNNPLFVGSTIGTGFQADLRGSSFGGPTFNYPNFGDHALAALYFQVLPSNALSFAFNDVAGNFHRVNSDDNAIQGFDFPTDNDGLLASWYNAVGVSDGTTASLYINNVLVGTTDLTGSTDTSLARGSQFGGDWHAGGWSVGRGLYNGGHGDRAYGYIDEVRISNAALSPSAFLFAPPLAGCLADVNADGVVDGGDFVAFINAFGEGSVVLPDVSAADVNTDGIVDGNDFVAFINAFGAGC